jgi:hypothetical protein
MTWKWLASALAASVTIVLYYGSPRHPGPDVLSQMAADEVVTVISTRDLVAVGAWYEDFRQTTDEEVVALLARGPRD